MFEYNQIQSQPMISALDPEFQLSQKGTTRKKIQFVENRWNIFLSFLFSSYKVFHG